MRNKFLLSSRSGGVVEGWDLSNAAFNGGRFPVFDVSSEESAPRAVSFKPDGTKMYVCGNNGDDVNEYDLSTAWDVTSASYLQNFSVSAQETNPFGLFFKSDGTKMYVCGNDGDDVNEYNLSTAWDVTSASYLQNFSVATEDTTPYGLFFKPDGTKMYVMGNNGDDVNEYNLSTAWNISTASYVQNFSVATEDTSPLGLFFKPDGTKMYVIGGSGDDVNEYDLSTAWDVSSASFIVSFSVSKENTSPSGLFFKPDGTKMYVAGNAGDEINEYDLSTAWDISSATFEYPSDYFGIEEDTVPQGLFFKPDGTKMYTCGSTGDNVYEYDLSTAWDITSTSYLQNFSISEPSDIFFKPDGTKMYTISTGSDNVTEYDLSTAWDVTSASLINGFSVRTQEATPQGLFFKPDGTKMYVSGSTGDDVNEYDLSTAWDVTSASYLQNYSLPENVGPQGLFFKPDGTKMYVADFFRDYVSEYELSTAWDVTSASHVLNFNTSDFSAESLEGVFFKPDGTKMYVLARSTLARAIFAFDL